MLSNLKAQLIPLYEKIFPSWIEDLKRELRGCDTVLDLGCGYNSPIRYCNVPYSVGVDVFEPYLEESKRNRIHNQYIKADVMWLELRAKSFDAVIALDLVEHLTKKDSILLLDKMSVWARKKVIISTPNGYIWQDGYDENPLQEHKCGWTVMELKSRGFQVIGFNGWKQLRGYKASVKYKPAFLWGRVSDITQKVTRRWPEQAFQLFAVKVISDDKE